MKNEITMIDNETIILFDNIKNLIEHSRNRVYKAVNTEMINLYWNIGKMIAEKQNGNKKAKYKDYIIEQLSLKLTQQFGKGFSKRNLERMRKLYMYYPIATTLSSQLTWSHYVELIKIDNELKRNFYMNECINSSWNVRELQRQRTTLLYERLIGTKNKSKLLDLSK